MCGIAGFSGLELDDAAARSLAETMGEAMRSRGPDGGGVATHPEATLAMKRLAIVDIAGGQQPMASDDGQIVLVFNGEIYNAPALRARLEGEGVRFHTRSDTEVILRLFERDPDDVEPKLAGMWAFAVHDRRRHRLTLSRDRFGIKPLFVADAGGPLAFASELRCFAAVARRPSFARLFEVDPAAAHAMLAWGYVPGERTIYRGVRRLAPGERLEVELRGGGRSARRYWSLAPSPEAARVGSLGEACELVEPLLRRAVREHLESDVPVAAFVSGGIDSSLVAAYAVDASPAPVETYCVGFRDARFDESPFAQDTARRLGTTHTVAFLAEETARSAVPDALLAYDEPFGDSSCVATYLLARLVSRRHKVALGGDGGDEVFAGYRKHRIVAARAFLDPVPGGRALVARALSLVPTPLDRTGAVSSALRTVGRVARGLRGDDAEGYVALTQVASLASAAPLAADPRAAGAFVADAVARYHDARGDALRRTLACDLGGALPNDMLTKVDRATMACSLEARVPLLDHRLVAAGLGLPPAFTLGDSGKRVLRELHERRFGPRLARRKKQGFSVPVESWLRGHLAPACDVLFERRRLARDGLLAPDALSDGRWRAWATSAPQLLWHALALAAWAEATLGEGPGAVRDAFDRSVGAALPSAPPAPPSAPRTGQVAF